LRSPLRASAKLLEQGARVPFLTARWKPKGPARNIGERGQWEQWRLLVLDCGEKGHFNISIGSRPSLGNAAVVSIEQGVDRIELGFYEGAKFWSWLQTIPESAALGGSQQPCK
jgi:hypothetical protein